MHQVVVNAGHGFDQLLARSGSGILQIFRDVDDFVFGTFCFVFPDQTLHRDQVDDAFELIFQTDRDCSATGFAPRREIIDSNERSNDAPARSSLLMKQILGTPYLSAWRQTVSDCGSTPATPSNTATAPSRTRSERSTSIVKSTWPGVSMILMR